MVMWQTNLFWTWQFPPRKLVFAKSPSTLGRRAALSRFHDAAGAMQQQMANFALIR